MKGVIRIKNCLGKLEIWPEVFKMSCYKGQSSVLDLLKRISIRRNKVRKIMTLQ